MGAGLDHVLKPLGSHIKHIVVVHGVQGVDHRLFQLAGGKQPEDPHAELGVNVQQIGIEPADDGQPLQVQGIGHAVAVDAFERNGGAVEHPVLDVVFFHRGAGGDDEHLVALGLQSLLESFNVGDYAADEGKIGFGKNCDPHSKQYPPFYPKPGPQGEPAGCKQDSAHNNDERRQKIPVF